MSSVRGLGEIVLWVRDMKRSLMFYRDTLGLTQMFTPDMRGAVFLQAGPEVVHCPQQLVLVPLPAGSEAFPSERNKRTLHHFGLEIDADAFDAEQARLKTAGLEVRYGEHPFLQLRGMYIDDPDGNEVELIARRP